MKQEERVLQKRFQEMAQRAYMENRYFYTAFLGEMEQDILLQSEQEFPVAVSFFGGSPIAERRIAVFGDEQTFGYGPQYPVALLRFSPVSAKFAETLTHRDVLGALMHIGVERDTIGDIFLKENSACVFCMEHMAEYIMSEMTRIRHTVVTAQKCSLAEAEQLTLSEPETQNILVASLRLDAVIAAVYHLSRQESQRFIREKKVFVNGRLNENNSGAVKEESMISVRTKGRFLFERIAYETKKGKYQIICQIYR